MNNYTRNYYIKKKNPCMNLRKSLVLFFAIAVFCSSLLFTSCNKDNPGGCTFTNPTDVATSAEIAYLQNYVTANSITAIQHPSGVFYQISTPGSGTNPGVCSIIRVNYEGRLFNGSRFDFNNSTNGASFTLGQLIKGWQLVLPLIKPNGVITLYIPPSLGYGSRAITDGSGGVVIPADSYLKFDITLRDVQ